MPRKFIFSTVLYLRYEVHSNILHLEIYIKHRSPKTRTTRFESPLPENIGELEGGKQARPGLREGSKAEGVLFFCFARGCNFGSERAEDSLFGKSKILRRLDL